MLCLFMALCRELSFGSYERIWLERQRKWSLTGAVPVRSVRFGRIMGVRTFGEKICSHCQLCKLRVQPRKRRGDSEVWPTHQGMQCNRERTKYVRSCSCSMNGLPLRKKFALFGRGGRGERILLFTGKGYCEVQEWRCGNKFWGQQLAGRVLIRRGGSRDVQVREHRNNENYLREWAKTLEVLTWSQHTHILHGSKPVK